MMRILLAMLPLVFLTSCKSVCTAGIDTESPYFYFGFGVKVEKSQIEAE